MWIRIDRLRQKITKNIYIHNTLGQSYHYQNNFSVSLAFDDYKAAENESGSPIVVCHGMLGSR